MVTRRDYENARKNASKENTEVSNDEGYLNQRLNMDWGLAPELLWGRSLQFNPAPPVPPDFALTPASRMRVASRLWR